MPSNTTFNPRNVQDFEKQKLFKDGRGVSGTMTAGATSYLDYTLTDDILLTGGDCLARGVAEGDKVDFQVLAPDGLGGWVLAAQFITDWFLNPDSTLQPIPKSSYPAKLSAGMKLRVAYHSVGASDVWIAVNYDMEKVLV